MLKLEGCQLPGIPKFSVGRVAITETSAINRFKRFLALPWNLYAKRWLKQAHAVVSRMQGDTSQQLTVRSFAPAIPFRTGDLVRVRGRDEINATLNPFKELKGCAFLPEMYQYCGTEQRVLKAMQRFVDERDYKVKKARGVVLLENVICNGTPTFGACDRCCFLFWREEWLEQLS